MTDPVYFGIDLSSQPDRTAYVKNCLECGEVFGSSMPHGDFCDPACRRAWNNRRAQRGAAIYDLFMATRYQRDLVGPLKLWRALNRLAAQFREEDRRDRRGRRSWTPPREVLLRRPWLNCVGRWIPTDRT